MARALSTATVLGLLAATAVAFAITERAKLTLSPIASTKVTKTFSPKAYDPAHRTATIAFRLRTSERVTAWIEDADGTNVRTLLPSRSERKGAHLDLEWDGFGGNGLLEPDGVYRPVVKLETSHRTIVLPNPIRVDTRPPRITVPHPLHPILSPDGDHHGDVFRVTYRVDEPAHGILYLRVDGHERQIEFTLSRKPTGVLEWNGKIRADGGFKPAPRGTYLLSVAAQDTAGNRSKPYPFALATVRYVALGRNRVVVRPGRRFAIRVSTDAPTVQWRLHGRSGVARRGTLHFRAPKKPGVYFLYVFAAGHAARAAVVVG